ncbi:sensor histidine kinase [Xylanibacillus composti]|nr:histidine kinase [Xylanibacillus composti]MDT9726997.1 sensor histidine kinase [Xylanibacillus composti]
MSYKQIKWLILIIPTLTIGIWEYVRHEFLLPYISMEMGNWLAPLIVFLVSVLFLNQLFRLIEHNQAALNEAKAVQTAMMERERIARELHDGIAQSLFLLNAQIDRIDKLQQAAEPTDESLRQLKENVHRTNTYVRQAIANLRYPADPVSIPWMQSIQSLIDELQRESELEITMNWRIEESCLSAKEKVELLASTREALLNIHKHAEARHVRIESNELGNGGWEVTIADDGKGFDTGRRFDQNRYGIRMMEDRAKMMNWSFHIERVQQQTVVLIRKEKKG